MPGSDDHRVSRTIYSWLYLLPPLILTLFIYIIPLVYGAAISLHEFQFSPPGFEFVGFSNYKDLFADEAFLTTLGNTFFSPLLLARILLVAVFPLSLALLLMELRSGARAAIHALLSPLVIFSGAVVTAGCYAVYFLRGGLAVTLLNSRQQELWNSFFTGEPRHFLGSVYNILLANGLAYSVPLGVAVYLAAMRGIRAVIPDRREQHREFWKRTWRLGIVFFVCVIGFSLTGLEGAETFSSNQFRFETILSYLYNQSFMLLRFGHGAASVQFLVLPLLLAGLGMILFLERKETVWSFRFVRKSEGKLIESGFCGKWRLVLRVASALTVPVLLFFLATVFLLPLLGVFLGPTGHGAGDMARDWPRFVSAFSGSLVIALFSALLCHAFSSAAGFILGFIRPRGTRTVLVLIGSFLFFSPLLLSIPYYFLSRPIGLPGTGVSLILPCLLSPLGVILGTWFFRGLREERDMREKPGSAPEGDSFRRRAISLFGRFSIPLLAVYLLNALNLSLFQFIMLGKNVESSLNWLLYQSAPKWLTMVIMGPPDMRSPSETIRSSNVFLILSLLQYILPLALLVLSAVFVFPRLALIVRRKGEAPSPPDAAVIDELKE